VDFLSDVNWALVAPLIVLQAILMVAALASCLKQEETNGPKGMWILVIIFVNIIGPVLYFVIGRKSA
jgi:hypothetical protein